MAIISTGSMSNAHIHTYEGNVRHIVQQTVAKLLDTVTVRNLVGKDHAWDSLGVLEAQLKNVGVRQDTPLQDAPWERRISLPLSYDVGTSTEQEDPTFMLVDPNSNLTMVVAAAMKRKQDDIIIAAATGVANKEDGSPIPFKTASQHLGSSNNPISISLLSDIQEIFTNNEIDQSVNKYAVIPASVVKTFMNDLKSTSSDYVQAQVLQQYGIVKNWMGFDWRISTRLLHPTANSTTCLFYTKQALGVEVNMDIKIEIAKAPTKRFMWIIYAMMTLGAVRIEDEQLVSLEVAGK